MRVTVVDPPAYTPAYDHSLCAALARQGPEVELVTSRFRHGPVQAPEGYSRTIRFYRRGNESAAWKAAQHPFDMLGLARAVGRDHRDVVHFQWLPIPQLDRRLVRRFDPPLVMTAHDVLPREGGAARRRATREVLDQMDAVVVHSEHGRGRLLDELGIAQDKVRVIPHGAFDYLTRLPEEVPLDRAVGALDGRKVVLCFGLMRPYKGIDVLIEAFASAPADAVLLVVGRAMMPLEPLQRRTRELGISDRVRLLPRFISDPEIPAYFRRADVLVLPYLEIEQSGVLCTALAFGTPIVASAVGAFVELGERHGAARLVPPGDALSLGRTLTELLADDEGRAALSEAGRRAAAEAYSWERAAKLTVELYRSLQERSG
jgi:glycosyltransferase involved in cell wall biosynthesis